MRIQGITIEVSDLAASKDFYENVLGFQPASGLEPWSHLPFVTVGASLALAMRQPRIGS